MKATSVPRHVNCPVGRSVEASLPSPSNDRSLNSKSQLSGWRGPWPTSFFGLARRQEIVLLMTTRLKVRSLCYYDLLRKIWCLLRRHTSLTRDIRSQRREVKHELEVPHKCTQLLSYIVRPPNNRTPCLEIPSPTPRCYDCKFEGQHTCNV